MSRSIPLEDATVAEIRVESLNNGSDDSFEFSPKSPAPAHTPEWRNVNESDPGAAQDDDAFVFSNGAQDGETEGLLLPAVQTVRTHPAVVEDDPSEIDAFSRSVTEEETAGLLLPAVQAVRMDDGPVKDEHHDDWIQILSFSSGATEHEPTGLWSEEVAGGGGWMDLG